MTLGRLFQLKNRPSGISVALAAAITALPTLPLPAVVGLSRTEGARTESGGFWNIYTPGFAQDAVDFVSSERIDQWAALENQTGGGKLFDLTEPMDRLIIYKIHKDKKLTAARFTSMDPEQQELLRSGAKKSLLDQIDQAADLMKEVDEGAVHYARRNLNLLAHDLVLFHYAMGDTKPAIQHALARAAKDHLVPSEDIHKAAVRYAKALGRSPLETSLDDAPVRADEAHTKKGPGLQPSPVVKLPASLGLPRQLTQIYEDAAVKIVSDDRLTRDQAQMAARIFEDAYTADIGRQRWTDARKLRDQIVVAVLSEEPYKQLAGKAAGITLDEDHFVIPSRLLKDDYALTTDDRDTFAHELTHILQDRAGGSRLRYIPILVQEGMAYVSGAMYTLSQKLVNPEAQNIHKQLGELTPEAAKDIFKHFRTGADENRARALHLDETTGGLFIEFLRTRLGGKGFPDALARLAKVIVNVGHGEAYIQAFETEFHVTPKQAEESFLKYLKDTQHHPDERLKGTIWQSVAQEKQYPLTPQAIAGIKARVEPEMPNDLHFKKAIYGHIVGGKLFVHTPKGKDVEQREFGDCYLDEALCSWAEEHPEDIEKAARDNGNGTYTFTFWRRARGSHRFHPVEITISGLVPMINGKPIGANSGPHSKELWVPLFEKAYGEMLRLEAPQDQKGKKKDEKKITERGYAALNEGGLAGHAMEALTGAPAIHMSLLESDKMQIFKYLTTAHRARYLLEAETYESGSGDDGIRKMLPEALKKNPTLIGKYNPATFDYQRHGLVDSHAYTVWATYKQEATDPERLDGGPYFVVLRNPWGAFEPKQWRIPDWLRNKLGLGPLRNDGFFAMPLDDFMALYDGIYIGAVRARYSASANDDTGKSLR